MTKEQARKLCNQIEDALEPIVKGWGFDLAPIRSVYRDHGITVKLEFAEKGDDGVVMDKEAQRFIDLAVFESQGWLTDKDFGARFVDRMGKFYTITGLYSRGKFLIRAKADDGGATMKWTMDFIIGKLRGPDAARAFLRGESAPDGLQKMRARLVDPKDILKCEVPPPATISARVKN